MFQLSLDTIFLLHLLATVFMTGLVWFVQIVHYPLFAQIPKEAFVQYEISHQQRTTFVVLPAMCLELLTGIILALSFPYPLENLFLGSLVALGLIWLSTFLIQVPLHAALSRESGTVNIHRLVLSNWIRTVLWSIRSLALLAILALQIAALK